MNAAIRPGTQMFSGQPHAVPLSRQMLPNLSEAVAIRNYSGTEMQGSSPHAVPFDKIGKESDHLSNSGLRVMLNRAHRKKASGVEFIGQRNQFNLPNRTDRELAY